MRSTRTIPILVAALLLLPSVRSSAQTGPCNSVNMTSTAEITTDPGYEGLWKYTIDGNWDVGRRALSHMDIFLGLETCPSVCDAIVSFSSPTGFSDGEDGGGSCMVLYDGSYLCNGDPSIPADLQGKPAVKMEYQETGCEPGVTGAGTWWFYSPLQPGASGTHPGAIAIKHGQSACTGDLVGVLPSCPSTTSMSAASWTTVKASYR